MGTGLIAPFYRAANRLRQRALDHVRSEIMPEIDTAIRKVSAQADEVLNSQKELASDIRGEVLNSQKEFKAFAQRVEPYLDPANDLSSTSHLAIKDYGGVLNSTSQLSQEQRSLRAMAYAYRSRSECALDVASTYPGGDYLEFGSTGLASFRSFLAAFYLHHGDATNFTDSRFYAFDIFGNPDHGRGPPTDQRDYFEGHRVPLEYSAPLLSLEPYGSLKERCFMVPGYFQDTLNDELKAKRRAEERKIGYAFIDCSLGESYKVVLDFLIDVMTPDRMFIYLDEYFIDVAPSVHTLYQEFTRKAKQRYDLDSIYMRNADGCGALFCLMPTRTRPE